MFAKAELCSREIGVSSGYQLRIKHAEILDLTEKILLKRKRRHQAKTWSRTAEEENLELHKSFSLLITNCDKSLNQKELLVIISTIFYFNALSKFVHFQKCYRVTVWELNFPINFTFSVFKLWENEEGKNKSDRRL